MNRWIKWLDLLNIIAMGVLLLATPIAYGLNSLAYTNALLLVIWLTFVTYVTHTK